VAAPRTETIGAIIAVGRTGIHPTVRVPPLMQSILIGFHHPGRNQTLSIPYAPYPNRSVSTLRDKANRTQPFQTNLPDESSGRIPKARSTSLSFDNR
jgi:hypothetical protein